jgi:hypothetical protein
MQYVTCNLRIMKNFYSSIGSIAIVLSFILSPSLAFAKDHSALCQVGVFSSTGSVSDASYSDCADDNCSACSAAHDIHFVHTHDGIYSIEAPVSEGRSFCA